VRDLAQQLACCTFAPRAQARESPGEVGREHEGGLDECLARPAGRELCPRHPAQQTSRARAQRRVELWQAPDGRALKDGEPLDFRREAGMTWIAEAPVPITATRLPRRST